MKLTKDDLVTASEMIAVKTVADLSDILRDLNIQPLSDIQLNVVARMFMDVACVMGETTAASISHGIDVTAWEGTTSADVDEWLKKNGVARVTEILKANEEAPQTGRN